MINKGFHLKQLKLHGVSINQLREIPSNFA